MRLKPLFSLLLMSALTLACAKPCHVIWTEGATNSETGKTVHTLEIQNPPKGTDWTIWFCQFRTPVTILEGEGRIGETLHKAIGQLERVELLLSADIDQACDDAENTEQRIEQAA